MAKTARVCGELGASSAIESVSARCPGNMGAKETAMEQVALGATVAPAQEEGSLTKSPKLPEAVLAPMCSELVPVLLTTKLVGVLTRP